MHSYTRYFILSALTIILAAGLVNLAGSGQIVIVTPDSLGFFGPAADYIERGEFTHWFARQFIYPAFLLMVLQISTDPLAILYAQKILLAITYFFGFIVTYLLVDDYRRLTGKRSSVKAQVLDVMVYVFAALIFALFVFYGALISLSHAIMAETLFAFVLMSIIYLIILQNRFTSSKLNLTIQSLIITLSILFPLVKPHYMVGSAFLVMFIYWTNRHATTAAKLVLILVTVSIAFMGHGYEYHLKHKYDYATSTVFGPKTLFCNNADLMYKYFSSQSKPDIYILKELKTQLDAGPVGGWNLQGFDGDKCTYGNIAGYVTALYPANPDAEKDFFINNYQQAALQYPTYIISRLYKQLSAVFKQPFTPHFREASGDCSQMIAYKEATALSADWAGKCEWFTGSTTYRSMPSTPIEYFNKLFSPLLLTAMIFLGYVSIIKPRLTLDEVESQSGRNLVCFAAMFVLGNLLVSLTHTFDVHRYYIMQAPLIFVLFLSAMMYIFSFTRKNLVA